MHFNCQRFQEYVALEDIKWTIERYVDADILQALTKPKNTLQDKNTAIQKLSKAMSKRIIYPS